MKGIIMAGGWGRRLGPVTTATTKHLLPVYNKPLIYYPITTLILSGVYDILIVTAPRDLRPLKFVLGDGSDWGCKFSYVEQPEPRGVADAYVLGAPFVQRDPSVLILGDNIFYGDQFATMVADATRRNRGATIFGYRVEDPRRFGVVEFEDDQNIVSLEEKPTHPRSKWAVTGLYVYDGTAADLAADLRPSHRGELEITDLNRAYLERGTLDLNLIGRGHVWFDAGTPETLLEASALVHSIENRQGLCIACPEEAAFRLGLIDSAQVERLADRHSGSTYGDYLRSIASGGEVKVFTKPGYNLPESILIEDDQGL